MNPVLFRLPVVGLPIHGYGAMVAIAFFLAIGIICRLARQRNLKDDVIMDMAFWIFLFGLTGARAFFCLQYRQHFKSPLEFFYIWQGGLVIYGAALGGLFGFLLFTRWHQLPRLWLLDTMAPGLALGMAVGRWGCLLFGCCYGDYCDTSLGIRFPAASGVYDRMVSNGFMSRLGFVTYPQDRRVWAVEPHTPAAGEGLRPGDEILAVNQTPVANAFELRDALNSLGKETADWPKIQRNPLLFAHAFTLEIRRDGTNQTITLTPPAALPAHPTQIYMSLKDLAIFLFLLAFFPFRRRNGEVIALFAICYSISRFLVEFVRFDEAPIAFGLTISQNGSIVFFIVGLIVWFVLARGNPHQVEIPVAARIDTA